MIKTNINDCYLIDIKYHSDSRGSFCELYKNHTGLYYGTDIPAKIFDCNQINISKSCCDVLRGIHCSNFYKRSFQNDAQR